MKDLFQKRFATKDEAEKLLQKLHRGKVLGKES